MSFLLYETYSLEELIELVAEQRFDKWFESKIGAVARIDWVEEPYLKALGAAKLTVNRMSGVKIDELKVLDFYDWMTALKLTLSFSFMLPPQEIPIESRVTDICRFGECTIRYNAENGTLNFHSPFLPLTFQIKKAEMERWHTFDVQFSPPEKVITAIYLNSSKVPFPTGWESIPLTVPVYGTQLIGAFSVGAYIPWPIPAQNTCALEAYFDDIEVRTGYYISPPPKAVKPFPWWIAALAGGIGGVVITIAATRKAKKKEAVVSKW